MGSWEAGIMGFSALGEGSVVVVGGLRIISMMAFSKDSLYGTVAGEKSTMGWGCGEVGEAESMGVRGALDIGVSSCAMICDCDLNVSDT